MWFYMKYIRGSSKKSKVTNTYGHGLYIAVYRVLLLYNFIAIYFTQFPAKNILSCVLSVYLCCRLMMIVWHWFLMLLLIWRWEVLILNHPDSHLNGNISSVFLIFRRIFQLFLLFNILHECKTCSCHDLSEKLLIWYLLMIRINKKYFEFSCPFIL